MSHGVHHQPLEQSCERPFYSWQINLKRRLAKAQSKMAAQPTKSSHQGLLEAFLEDPNTMRLQQSDKMHSFHVALLVCRGKILEVASNRIGSRSRGSGYGHYTICAERNVIKQLGNLQLLKGCDLFIMKIHEHKETGERTFCYSRPCHFCEVFLSKCQREYGLKNIYYTEFSSDPVAVNNHYTKKCSSRKSADSKAPSIHACLRDKLSPQQ